MNVTLVEMNELMNDEDKGKEELEIELSSRLEILAEVSKIIKKLDEDIGDLIEDENEAEKDEKEALGLQIKL